VDDSRECGYLLDGIKEYFIEWNRHYLSSVDGLVDVVAIGDDYGMQDRTLFSPEMWRKQIKPRYGELMDSFKSRYSHILFFHHSCGSIFPLVEDLIDMWIDILNPIQPTAKDMDPKNLKETYGDRITFHGALMYRICFPLAPQRRYKEKWLGYWIRCSKRGVHCSTIA
jgi:uroporphyrinogen decarboxylase